MHIDDIIEKLRSGCDEGYPNYVDCPEDCPFLVCHDITKYQKNKRVGCSLEDMRVDCGINPKVG